MGSSNTRSAYFNRYWADRNANWADVKLTFLSVNFFISFSLYQVATL